MVELGQLEGRQQDFDHKNVRVVAASPDTREDTANMQEKFPHLLLVSDADNNLAEAAHVLGPHHGADGKITNSPTTVFIDKQGVVRWLFRPDRFLTRLSAEEVLANVDEHFGKR